MDRKSWKFWLTRPGAPIVGLHVGGRGGKRWPLERFAEVARRLLSAGCQPWIFRGPRETDVEEHFRQLDLAGITLVPPASIVNVGHAFQRCTCVLAPDTGPMHLASALRVPTLALFHRSDADRYRPFGPHDRVIDARGRDLGVEEVQEQALALVGQLA